MKNKLVIGIFIVYIFGMGIWQLAAPDREFSQMENRALANAPEFSMEALTEGQFTSDMETYLADQVPLKDAMVKLKIKLEQTMGRSKVNGVFFGKKETYLSDYVEDTKSVRKNIMQIAEWMKECTVPATMFIVPNSIKVWSDRLPNHAVTDDQETTVEYTKSYLSEHAPQLKLVDSSDKLIEHQDEPIYYRTDHHWTMLGAYYGYQTLMESMGRSAKPIDAYNKKLLSDDFLGSLYSKAPMIGCKPDRLEYYESPDADLNIQFEDGKLEHSYINKEFLNKKDKYATFLGGNYGRIEITNSQAVTQDTLVICKDSYTNCMLPFLSDEFAKIIVIDFRYYKDDLQQEIVDSEATELVFSYNIDFLTTDDHFTWLTLGKK